MESFLRFPIIFDGSHGKVGNINCDGLLPLVVVVVVLAENRAEAAGNDKFGKPKASGWVGGVV